MRLTMLLLFCLLNIHAVFVGDDTDGHIGMPRSPDFLTAEGEQRCSGFDLVPRMHEIGEAVALHIYRINAHMEQNLHAVRERHAHRMAGILHQHHNFAGDRGAECFADGADRQPLADNAF